MAQAEATTERAERVSTLELFFDLVFVFAVTQLTALLAAEPDAVGWSRSCCYSSSSDGCTTAMRGSRTRSPRRPRPPGAVAWLMTLPGAEHEGQREVRLAWPADIVVRDGLGDYEIRISQPYDASPITRYEDIALTTASRLLRPAKRGLSTRMRMQAGDRFWGQVRGFPGRFRVPQGKGVPRFITRTLNGDDCHVQLLPQPGELRVDEPLAAAAL